MDLRLLYIEDDETNRRDLISVLSGEVLSGHTVNIDAVDTFEDAIRKITSNHYHIVILDIYKGKPDNGGEQEGLIILKQIQNQCFIPVVFYSGNTKNVQSLKSQIVGVVTKGDDGIDGLKSEIERLLKFNLPFVKENIHSYLGNELKEYFWNIIHKERNKFTADKNDFSLGYLMLRKFGNSLSREKISDILGDRQLANGKVHSMEFYLYPTDITQEYECGEILKSDNNVFVILTPSCDFVDRGGGKRKVGEVLLAKTQLLSDTAEYKSYCNKKKEDGKDKSAKEMEGDKNKLIKVITSGKSDRYFFLPSTPFMENRVIDFQVKEMVKYENLGVYSRLAKLDSPFAQAMVASFIRYYNRIGYPDIDSDLIISAM